MLIVYNFHPLVVAGLKTISYFTVPLQIFRGNAKTIEVANEKQFRRRTHVSAVYVVVVVCQWIYAWSKEPLPTILESMSLTVVAANTYVVRCCNRTLSSTKGNYLLV